MSTRRQLAGLTQHAQIMISGIWRSYRLNSYSSFYSDLGVNFSMTEMLIACVKEHPAIYDKSHKHYKDRSGFVAKIWKKIWEEMTAAGHDMHGESMKDFF